MKYFELGFLLELCAGLLGHRAAICSIADKEEKGEGGLRVSRRPEHRLEQSRASRCELRWRCQSDQQLARLSPDLGTSLASYPKELQKGIRLSSHRETEGELHSGQRLMRQQDWGPK